MENKPNEENLHTYDNGFHPKKVVLKPDFKFYRKDFWFKFKRKLTIIFTKFYLFFPKHFAWNFKTVGRENIKNAQGTLIICNHVHQFDVIYILASKLGKKCFATVLQSNLGFGLVSKYFVSGGAVPIPEDAKLFKTFSKETTNTLKENYSVIVCAEAALVPFCDHVRPFLPGAFHFAYQAGVKITPVLTTFHKPKGIYKLLRRNKPCLKLNILPQYEIKDLGNKKLSIETACNELHEIMANYFNEHSDYFKDLK